MKTFKLLIFAFVISNTKVALATTPAGSESFPVLEAKDLEQRLASGSKTLKEALAVQKKTPGSVVTARGEYYSWLGQCIGSINNDAESPLWEGCLRFASQILRVEASGETASQLAEPYKKHRAKWDATVKRLEDADRLYINQEAQDAAADLED